jgi:ribosomal protein S18 acetylase RimI-like enzyme
VAPPIDPSRVAMRRATIADLTVIVEMRLAMIGEITDLRRASGARTNDVDLDAMRGPSELWVAEHIDRDFLAWIADVDGQPAGSVGLLWFMHPPGPTNSAGTEAYLLNVYTRPEARGMGLATGLMGLAFEAAREAGVKRVWLRTSAAGRPLYESLGFRAEDDGMRLVLE